MKVGIGEVATAIRSLGLEGKAVCLHSSLRSFGWVDGGAPAVVQAFLSEACTLMVPTFTSWYESLPPAGRWIERNGLAREGLPAAAPAIPPYRAESADCSDDMGAIPRAVALMAGRERSNHPLMSFCALGPHARDLVEAQSPTDVYAPFRSLIERDGWVVLAGVGLDRMTLIHHAEQVAGREQFRRWAVGRNGESVECVVAGCSNGFENLRPVVEGLSRSARAGEGVWEAYPARELVAVAADAIRRDPAITACGREACIRCPDAVAGGPIL